MNETTGVPINNKEASTAMEVKQEPELIKELQELHQAIDSLDFNTEHIRIENADKTSSGKDESEVKRLVRRAKEKVKEITRTLDI